MVNSLELFSDAGGLAKGIEMAGATHTAFVEWNSYACKTLRYNYNPEIVHETDIRHFDFQKFSGVDLIAGGPPCQPFSMGGKAKGFEDERDMFPYAISAIEKLTPVLMTGWYDISQYLKRNAFKHSRTTIRYLVHGQRLCANSEMPSPLNLGKLLPKRYCPC